MTQPVWNPPPGPTPGGPTYQQLGTSPRKVWARKKALWVVAAAFVAGSVLTGLGSASTPTPTPAAAPVPALTVTKVVTVPAPPRVIAPPAPEGRPTTKPAPPKPAAPKPVTIPGDGTFLVPADVKPGTYKSTGPSADGIGSCYWARLGDTAGDNILANNLAEGPAVVTIKAGDKAFRSQSCNEWTKVA